MLLNIDIPINKHIDINSLSEDAIRTITKMNFINDKEVTTLEFEEYIDNTILYFESRLSIIKNTFRYQYGSFNKMIRRLLKELNSYDEYNIDIKLRKPTEMYYKVISPNILKDINSVTFDSLYNNNGPGADITKLYSLKDPIYNKIVKTATISNVNRMTEISKLYYNLSEEVSIKNKDELKKYFNSVSFPINDIDIIESYINATIMELKQIKRSYKSDDNKFNKIVKCTNVLSILSMYRKNVINILLNIYSIKISILNVNSNLNESDVDEFSFINPTIILESQCLTEGKFKDIDIALTNFNSTFIDYINEIELKLNIMYEQFNHIVDDIGNIDIYAHSFIDSSYINNLIKTVDSYDVNNIDRSIDSLLNRNQSEKPSCIFINDTELKKYVNIIIDNKQKIIDSIEYDYNMIKERIVYLRDTTLNNTIPLTSTIFERPFNSLGVYANDYLKSLQYNLRDVSDNIHISRVVNDLSLDHSDIVMALRELDRITDNYQLYKDNLMNLIHFVSVGYYGDLCNYNVDLNICHTDKILLLYMLHFKNKLNCLL